MLSFWVSAKVCIDEVSQSIHKLIFLSIPPFSHVQSLCTIGLITQFCDKSGISHKCCVAFKWYVSILIWQSCAPYLHVIHDIHVLFMNCLNVILHTIEMTCQCMRMIQANLIKIMLGSSQTASRCCLTQTLLKLFIQCIHSFINGLDNQMWTIPTWRR